MQLRQSPIHGPLLRLTEMRASTNRSTLSGPPHFAGLRRVARAGPAQAESLRSGRQVGSNWVGMMFAVVRTGGKQYRVAAGDKIAVEKLAGEAGDTITLGDVLLAGNDGEIADAAKVTVSAEIIAQARGEKVVVFKKKRRHNYRRKQGHRQSLTLLRILSVGAAQKKAAKTAAPKAAEAKTAAPKAATAKKAEPKVTTAKKVAPKAATAKKAAPKAATAKKAAPKAATAKKAKPKAATAKAKKPAAE